MTTHGDESRIVKDPICGKDVDTLRARAVGIFGGVTYYFCSADCKAQFKDPRQASPATPPADVGERRKPEKAEKPVSPKAVAAQAEEEPIRYAHSRMRRITGEVSTPVVQIDLSPHKKPEPQTADEEPVAPPRSGRGWAVLIVFMLIIAGGVIFYSLKYR
jgi:YHS domain-containing protein